MLLDDFAVDLEPISQWTQKKMSLGAWSVVSPLLTCLARLKRLLTSVQATNRELVEDIMTPLEFKQGR